MSSSKKEHDPLETVVRFVCGALAGGLVGFYMGFRWKLSGFLPMLAITMGFSLVFAFCAVRYGDDFWHGLMRR